MILHSIFSKQLNFFRKGLQSLEAVEPYIKNVAEKQHIDYELSELNDGEKDDGDNGSESNDYGELSFDYRPNEQELGSAYTLRNSMEVSSVCLFFRLKLRLYCIFTTRLYLK